jgi:hypothetical protein
MTLQQFNKKEPPKQVSTLSETLKDKNKEAAKAHLLAMQMLLSSRTAYIAK